MAEETLREEFENWGGGTKTARPANVGPHDVNDEQHDPKSKGVKPSDYERETEDSVAGKPGEKSSGPVNIGVRQATAGEGQKDPAAKKD
ncbi:hypothetical protein MVG78_06690 [Roseomonas gilardii subsp. gilardii]|uniref:hypothetical protein n=1 Tax=Roseomonas gilardii TaxID=257708 RepID=UPI001FFB0C25|nr:hypothetical protein [Roseomonas gilardii]UPG73821.1 hypothetical protein MVG78_06690 [Roseomonas gilardii subsp. gilardii]